MKTFYQLFLFVTLLLTSSCASILNSRFQPVAINTKAGDKILVNDEEPKTRDGKYLMRRDLNPKQITIKSEGYRDQNITIMQYKKSGLNAVSWIIAGVTSIVFINNFAQNKGGKKNLFENFILMAGGIYIASKDNGEKAFNYSNQVSLPKKQPILKKEEKEHKNVIVKEISAQIEKEKLKYIHYNGYRNYLRKQPTIGISSNRKSKKIEHNNTIFTFALNDLLKESGFIDTTKRALKSSYLNNLIVKATIKDYTLNHVSTYIAKTYKTDGFVFSKLSIDWEVLDYYNKPIHSETITSTSGQFALFNYDQEDNQKTILKSVKDATEAGFTKFMQSEKVVELLKDKSDVKTEKAFETINIKKPSSYVSTLGQAIKSSVTVKVKKGHGSGFFISESGHIITNYHVVADTTDMKIILNDESEYPAEVVRVSKIHDLALLKIKKEKVIPFKISPSKEFEIAKEVYAVGTPTAEDLSQTVSKGIISGVRKTSYGSKLIQTDASINGGNSGGALVTKEGEVLGVVSSKLKGFGIEGVAFGIPAHEIFDKLKIKIK